MTSNPKTPNPASGNPDASHPAPAGSNISAPASRNPAPRIDPRLKRQLRSEREERRYLAGLADTWVWCRRQACQRARACRNHHAICFDEHFDTIEATVESLLHRDAFEDVREEDFAAEYRALRTASKA